jgi:hypothetical protein
MYLRNWYWLRFQSSVTVVPQIANKISFIWNCHFIFPEYNGVWRINKNRLPLNRNVSTFPLFKFNTNVSMDYQRNKSINYSSQYHGCWRINKDTTSTRSIGPYNISLHFYIFSWLMMLLRACYHMQPWLNLIIAIWWYFTWQIH